MLYPTVEIRAKLKHQILSHHIFASQEKDLLFKFSGILLNNLLLSLNRAHLSAQAEMLSFITAGNLRTTEQGMVFSLVPGMCMHASLFLRFSCPLK